jgi:hypothetical protein
MWQPLESIDHLKHCFSSLQSGIIETFLPKKNQCVIAGILVSSTEEKILFVPLLGLRIKILTQIGPFRFLCVILNVIFNQQVKIYNNQKKCFLNMNDSAL